jgi:hypothetical protein
MQPTAQAVAGELGLGQAPERSEKIEQTNLPSAKVVMDFAEINR